MFKKIALIIGGLFLATSAYGAKKASDLIDISKKLIYDLVKIGKIDIPNKSVKIDLKITNPTEYDLQAGNITIKNITLSQGNKKPFTIVKKEISGFEIPANSDITLNDIEFIVNLNIGQMIDLATHLQDLRVNMDVQAFGIPVTSLSVNPL